MTTVAMTQPQAINPRAALPALLSAKHLVQDYGLTRTMAYQMLNRSDTPVVKIGQRLFMSRDRFDEWLDEQAQRA